VGLLPQDVKPCIFHNGCKSIPNGIMGCSPLPTMGTLEEVDPQGVLELTTYAMGQTKNQRMGEA
jgi:hypothetical protein